ncbi:hypothetical protein OIU77_016549 [Salix suchowensis]|uniref:Uncharacterized protein n=1 Tax=Salix suchowensis TaxID=1278906 RepID=A0ABQ8ZKZ0_9ROSI|nr:hypothetical protein OIU77_016549 [Salix suchowensis]
MQEDKKSKVKKGWLAVRVGLEDEDGPLRVPCSVDDFLHLRWRIEKESNQHSHHHHHHHHHSTSLSFHSC